MSTNLQLKKREWEGKGITKVSNFSTPPHPTPEVGFMGELPASYFISRGKNEYKKMLLMKPGRP